jgi:hypothetical protein
MKTIFASAFCVCALAGGAVAADPNAIYSNMLAGRIRGAEPTHTPGAASGGVTPMMADDITSVGGYLSTIRLMAVNFNNNAVSAHVNVSFWNADGAVLAPGAVQGPGTYLTGSMGGGPSGPISIRTGAVTLAAGDFTTVTIDLAAMNSRFTMPAGTVWVGVSFDSSTATDAQLGELGMALISPPEVGSSSADHMFKTTAAGTFVGVDNPAGVNPDFGFGPPKNLGMEFVIPAPGAGAVLALGGLAAMRRRRVG